MSPVEGLKKGLQVLNNRFGEQDPHALLLCKDISTKVLIQKYMMTSFLAQGNFDQRFCAEGYIDQNFVVKGRFDKSFGAQEYLNQFWGRGLSLTRFLVNPHYILLHLVYHVTLTSKNILSKFVSFEKEGH